MNFFKNLFEKNDSYVPSPIQQISGVEPIIVQAVENLFPNAEDQREIFKDLTENRKDVSTLIVLSLLSMSSTVKMWRDYNMLPGPIPDNTQYFIARDSGFSTMADAEKWVKSITRS
jgi:hypothetical protein